MLLLTLLLGAPAAAALVWAASGWVWLWPVSIVLLIAWAGGLAFFRDPERVVPAESGIMVAPADGRVVETVDLDYHPDIGGPARRISIFLSVFDVHINRSPCDGVVRLMRYEPGRYLDARDPESGRVNEANTIVIEPDDPSDGLVVVRQIAGLIARRIVCNLKVGDRVRRGQRIGLIKFGSRTELIFSASSPYRPSVQVGEISRGAVTIMARREPAGHPAQDTSASARV
ncbi:MAG TPA: phosphatidylserine decarboxylase [Phycisphaerae bacterium]|nr:phosphatidylserine decarboxylase [Phycisphaerae bacterium]HOJ74401.1 phosphatidylserine decarboxylase [Phycisphaerae bacterium]HON67365.1 phosphatidylserine decarboxylase [Phycisphaerae bacterium]HOQ86897.1 phosphatidylserine decarboxylase [Phycisphaerae bacterium]HPU28268.1 phosphatidylserine decarboxylase [Phycisphaerae bacterium]